MDVGIIVPVCFENPLKEHSVKFLSEVMLQRRRIALPTFAVIGAYHIATRYLRVPRVAAKKAIEGILRSGSPALYPQMRPEIAADGLDYASAYGMEAWDGCLISLAKSLGSSIIYSLDEGLSRAKEITVVNPFPRDEVERYHEFIEAGLRRL